MADLDLDSKSDLITSLDAQGIKVNGYVFPMAQIPQRPTHVPDSVAQGPPPPR